MLKTFNSEKRRSHEFLKAVRDAGSKWSDEQIAAYIFAEVVPTLSFFSQTLAHVVNHLLDDVHKADREAIAMLCTSLENDSSNRILACINEALRKSSISAGVRSLTHSSQVSIHLFQPYTG